MSFLFFFGETSASALIVLYYNQRLQYRSRATISVCDCSLALVHVITLHMSQLTWQKETLCLCRLQSHCGGRLCVHSCCTQSALHRLTHLRQRFETQNYLAACHSECEFRSAVPYNCPKCEQVKCTSVTVSCNSSSEIAPAASPDDSSARGLRIGYAVL